MAKLTKPKTRPFDVVEYLTDDGAMAGYLTAALEDGDAVLIADALGNVARAKGMPAVVIDPARLDFATFPEAIKGFGFKVTVTT